MKKQSEAQLSAANLPAVTDLTEEQANQVAGGSWFSPRSCSAAAHTARRVA
jgi:hypothetical protein